MNADAINLLALMGADQISRHFARVQRREYQHPVDTVRNGITFLQWTGSDAWVKLGVLIDQLREWHDGYTSGQGTLTEETADAVWRALMGDFWSWRGSVLNLAGDKFRLQYKEGTELVVWLTSFDRYFITKRRPETPWFTPAGVMRAEEVARLHRDLRYATGDDRREILDRLEQLGDG